MLDLFPDTIDRANHGQTWQQGNWYCRNHHGFMQTREGNRGPWQYIIHGFGDDFAGVLAMAPDGRARVVDVPIDDKDRITIHGRKYGRRYWQH